MITLGIDARVLARRPHHGLGVWRYLVRILERAPREGWDITLFTDRPSEPCPNTHSRDVLVRYLRSPGGMASDAVWEQVGCRWIPCSGASGILVAVVLDAVADARAPRRDDARHLVRSAPARRAARAGAHALDRPAVGRRRPRRPDGLGSTRPIRCETLETPTDRLRVIPLAADVPTGRDPSAGGDALRLGCGRPTCCTWARCTRGGMSER